MPTNGFTGFLQPSCWYIDSNEGYVSTSSPNTAVDINAYGNKVANYVLVYNPPNCGIVYSGTLSFNWVKVNGPSSNAIVIINGLQTLLTSSPYSVNLTAGTTLILRYDNSLNENESQLQITNFQFQYEVPCFDKGSKILCLKDDEEVYVSIQKIQKGDLVKTYKHGYKKVEIIGKKKIYNLHNEKKQNRMFKLSTDKFPDLFEDLYLTGSHAILVDSLTGFQNEMTKNILGQLFITDDKYRLISCLEPRAEMIETEKEYTVYNFALENDDDYMNYGVYANGLLVESSNLQYMKKFSGMKSL
jgi:hypothetical protein